MKKFFKYLLLTALFILLPTVTAFAEEKEVYKRRDGLIAGTYTIIETEAPKGYTTAEPQEVVLTDISNGNLNALQTAMAVFVDQKGALLPTTGGEGTAPFIIMGLLLLMTGAFLLYNRKDSEDSFIS